VKAVIGAVVLLLATPHAVGADAPGTQAARAALRTLVPDQRTSDLRASSLPGYFDTIIDGHVAYVSADGKYLVQGNVFRFADKADLTEQRQAQDRRTKIAGIKDTDTIIFAPAKPRYTVTVFTDIDCPYCEKFQQGVAQLNAAGVAVRYVLFPLNIHPQAHRKAMAVWCAKDRKGAFAAAIGGVDPGSQQCPNPLQANLSLAQELGVQGTPGIFASDGTQLGGFLEPAQLLAKLRASDPVARNLAETGGK